MKRLHLFEILDSSHIYAPIRECCTQYLEFICRKLKLAESLAPRLVQLCEAYKTDTIVDLCSGAGGPSAGIATWLREKNKKIKIELTDFFPHLDAFQRLQQKYPEVILFRSESVDATNVDSSLKGIRLMVNSFHHFNPSSAQAIIKSAWEARTPLIVVELSERKFLNIISFFFIPLISLLIIPLLKPNKWQVYVFTYLIPVIPFILAWDGLVSHLRVYNENEFRELAMGLGIDSKNVEFDRVNLGPGPAQYTMLTLRPLKQLS